MLSYFIIVSVISTSLTQQLFPITDYDLPTSFHYQQYFPQTPPFPLFEREFSGAAPITQEELIPQYGGAFLSTGVTSQPFLRTPFPTLTSLFPSEVERPQAPNEFSSFAITPITSLRSNYGSGLSKSYRLNSAEYSRRSSRRDSSNTRAPYVNRRMEERIVDKILDNLPALAASFMSSSAGQKSYPTKPQLPSNSRVIDTAPGRQSTAREINPKFLGGTPVAKSEDMEPDTSIKSTTSPMNAEEKSLLSEILGSILRSTNNNATGKNFTAERRRDVSSVWTHSGEMETSEGENKSNKKGGVLERLMSGDFGAIIQSLGNGLRSDSTSKEKESVDPLKSILSGRLDEVNWLNTILGSSVDSHSDEGNALMQLLEKPSESGGNPLGRLSTFLGSGLDDDPSVPNRGAKQNF